MGDKKYKFRKCSPEVDSVELERQKIVRRASDYDLPLEVRRYILARDLRRLDNFTGDVDDELRRLG